MKPSHFVLALSAALPLVPLTIHAASDSPTADPESSTHLSIEETSQALPSMDAKEIEAAWNSPAGKALHATWEREGWRFTPAVEAAYLAFAKAEAKRELAAEGHTLPDDFMAWVNGDPVVAATVYGARHDPAAVLTILRSLELDLGTDEVRRKHTQLALAMAVANSGSEGGKKKAGTPSGLGISLAPRPLLQVHVPGNPLKPVNTHPTDRPLDVNDHIINFFEGRTVEIVGKAPKAAKGEAAVPEKKMIPMAACDVIADPKLQAEFNAYMKAHGQSVSVNCGDHVVSRSSTAAVKGPEGKGVLEAYELFKKAYEAKGLLPASRDAMPTLAETCAWLIHNDETPLPGGIKRKWDKWPLFPLDAPWPVLTYLAQNRQPLREVQDIFDRYRDKGEFHGYGEYIGPIAQQFNFQSARRLAPYPFSYGTFQMMLKDGGVCGTMANIEARSELALGIPSSTAGQPGHCALVSMRFNPADKTYTLAGEQFVTGGPDKTTPHIPWVFEDDSARKPMIYPMTTTYAVNHGVQSFLDSSIAWKMCSLLPETERRSHGLALLESALVLNPYNMLLVDTAQTLAATPQAQLALYDGFSKLISAEAKPGCPTSGLYSQTVLEHMLHHVNTLPLPTDKALLSKLADLADKNGDADAWQKFETALHGLPAVQGRLLDELKAGVAGERTVEGTDVLAKRIQAVAKALPKTSVKSPWTDAMFTAIAGHETFTVGKRKTVKPDPCAPVIFKLAGKTAEAAAQEAARAKAQADAASRDLSKDTPEGAPGKP